MNLLEKLGFRFQKPDKVETTIDPEVKAELDENVKKRKEIAQDHSKQLASRVLNTYLSASFLRELVLHHDFTNPLWGARRVARVYNYASNILDIEIIEGRLEESDREPLSALLMIISFFHVMPVKDILRMENADDKYKALYARFLKNMCKEKGESVSDDTIRMICVASLSWEQTIPGENVVVDIFHDACRLDGIFFDQEPTKNLMRTELAKNDSFRAWTKKISVNNTSPNWMVYLQELVEGLVLVGDIDEEEERNKANEQDAFV